LLAGAAGVGMRARHIEGLAASSAPLEWIARFDLTLPIPAPPASEAAGG